MRGVPVGPIPGLPGLARRGEPGADAYLTLSRRKRRKYCGNSTNSKSAPKSRTICRPSRTCRKPPRGSSAPCTSSWPGPFPTKRVSRCKAGRRQARGTDGQGEGGWPEQEGTATGRTEGALRLGWPQSVGQASLLHTCHLPNKRHAEKHRAAS